MFNICRRKSITGLSIDFVLLSFCGFICYSIYNVCFYFSTPLKQESHIEVSLHDVIFSLHSTFLNFVLCIMVHFFRKKNEGPHYFSNSLLIIVTAAILIESYSVCSQLLGSYFQKTLMIHPNRIIKFSTFLIILGNIKLILTIIKYIPQVWMNWMRRSTKGWSIFIVICDMGGSIFSLAQLVLDIYLKHASITWRLLFGAKLGLGIISLFFASIFMIQHYVLYRDIK